MATHHVPEHILRKTSGRLAQLLDEGLAPYGTISSSAEMLATTLIKSTLLNASLSKNTFSKIETWMKKVQPPLFI